MRTTLSRSKSCIAWCILGPAAISSRAAGIGHVGYHETCRGQVSSPSIPSARNFHWALGHVVKIFSKAFLTVSAFSCFRFRASFPGALAFFRVPGFWQDAASPSKWDIMGYQSHMQTTWWPFNIFQLHLSQVLKMLLLPTMNLQTNGITGSSFMDTNVIQDIEATSK